MLEDFIEKIPNVDAEAQYGLGCRYYNGDGVKQDYKEAFKWFYKAAVQGYAKAQYQLGLCYYYGYGIKENNFESLRWFKKAAEQGDVKAQYFLGFYYFNIRRYKKAVKWLKEAAEQGHPQAQYYLGLRCYDVKKYDKAVEWFKKAAEQGFDDAQFKLGFCYEGGVGVDQDSAEAVKWFLMAARQGHARAQYYLGRSYEFGRGIEKDIDESIKWYRKSAEQGDEKAKYSLQSALHPRKDNWEKFLQVLKDYNIQYLYHFTDEDNISSIKEHGGLYSWDYCVKNNITIPRPGGNDVSRYLDCRNGLQDYVRLSFCDDHPMKHQFEEAGRKIFLLRIKIDVALWKDTLFSDMNATDNLHKYGGKLNDLKNVNFAATRRHYVSKEDCDFKYHQAEVMVKTFIPLEYIENL